MATSTLTTYTGKQFTIFVTLRVAPENIEKFKAVHRPLWKYVAEEPECLLFDVFEDLDAPGRFRFVEVWNQSREWFETVGLPGTRGVSYPATLVLTYKALATTYEVILPDSLGGISAAMD
ncbi:hypothetical protein BDV12DRAFT_202812 [Aspergillus spectabilis]